MNYGMETTMKWEPLTNSCITGPESLLSVEQALAYLIERAVPATEVERVTTADALYRVLGEDVVSPLDVPQMKTSAMDGYAVTSGALPEPTDYHLRVSQRIAAGGCGSPLQPGTAARIFTGAPLPEGADAVVVQERCERQPDDSVRIPGPVLTGENVRCAGDDVAAGAVVLKKGMRLRPQDIGLAAAIGAVQLPVFRRVRVALLSSGNELVMPGEQLKPGQCFNSNHHTLMALLKGLGCEVLDGGVMPDEAGATRWALKQAAQEADLVLASGGTSVGDEDHVRAAVRELGHIDLWRVGLKPGKPLAFGRIGAAAFIGLPGNPVSAFVTFCMFARPFILRLQGVVDVAPKGFWVAAGFERRVAEKRREYLRARLVTIDGRVYAEPHPKQGSGVLTSAVCADGLVDLAPEELVQRGSAIRFIPFSELLT